MSLGMALQLAALASHVTAAGAAGPPGRCGNSTTFCPAAADCCAQPYSPSKFGCKASNPANVSEGCGDGMAAGLCCKPGPGMPPSTALPNCLVIGDSVSIGYTDMGGIQRVQSHLEGVCQVILAIGETAILLHPPPPLVGGSILMERGCRPK